MLPWIGGNCLKVWILKIIWVKGGLISPRWWLFIWHSMVYKKRFVHIWKSEELEKNHRCILLCHGVPQGREAIAKYAKL